MRAARALLPFAVLLAASLAVVWPAQRAHACSCIVASDASYYASAAVVFIGEVVAMRDPDAGSATPDPAGAIRYTFAVERVQKGSVGDPAHVSSRRSGGLCGYGFAVGRRYQVFASESEGGLQTGICMGTRDLAESSAFLEAMPARSPAAASSRPAAPSPSAAPTAVSTPPPPLASLRAAPVATQAGKGEAGLRGVAALLAVAVALGVVRARRPAPAGARR